MNNKDFEPIRVRIMQEAYELADRNDSEGYNAIKVMCGDVQRMLPPQPKEPEQEPVGYVSEGEPDRLIAQKQTKTPLRNYRLFTHDVPLYTTPHTKVGCVECRVSGGHAFYCVACAKNLFGGYKK